MAFVPVCLIHELRFRKRLTKTVNGVSLALFWIEESQEIKAVGGKCPHAGGMIAAGAVGEGWVTCPSHSLRFSLGSGVCESNNRYRLPAYRIRLDDRMVYVDISPDKAESS